MIPVSFGEAFEVLREKLEGYQLKTLTPHCLWFASGGAVIGLSPNLDTGVIWVHWVAGDGKGWLKDIVREFEVSPYKSVEFQTEEGSRICSLVKYYKGALLVTESLYPSGKRAVLCSIGITDNPRR